eukprot:g1471.t1
MCTSRGVATPLPIFSFEYPVPLSLEPQSTVIPGELRLFVFSLPRSGFSHDVTLCHSRVAYIVSFPPRPNLKRLES